MMSSEKNIFSARKHSRLLHSQWLIHMDHCERTKLSHESYCAQNELSLKAFKKHYWRNERNKSLRAPVSESFVPIALSQSMSQASEHYEVQFSKGILLKIPRSTLLATILKSLKGYI